MIHKKVLIILALFFAATVLVGSHYEEPIGVVPLPVRSPSEYIKSKINNGYMPNPAMNPGKANPQVTQENMNETICNKKWTTDRVRPPTSYTNKLKVQQIRDYGYKDTDPSHYSEDHILSLWLSGDPTSPLNLFPQVTHINVNGFDYGSKSKDKIELKLHSLVCLGYVPLKEAQKELSTDWVKAYQTYIGELPKYEVVIGGINTNDE